MTNEKLPKLNPVKFGPAADRDNISAEAILKAHEESPFQLKSVPPDLVNVELCLAAIEAAGQTDRNSPSPFSFRPDDLPHSPMCTDAVSLSKGDFETKYPEMKR
jgi:hypothetical protein